MLHIFRKPQSIGLLLGPILFCIILQLPSPEGLSSLGWSVVACAVFMAIWWMTEAVPVAVTSLLPIVLFPLLDIVPLKEATAPYANPAIFLFMGGFMLATAMQRWSLHKRIALTILSCMGNNADHIIAGFMIASCLLSMWISNTATTVMMMPIGLSVISLLFDHEPSTITRSHRRFALCLMLGIAYAASAGGTATLIGTPPNTILYGFLQQQYGIEISFLQWMILGVPFACVVVYIIWVTLVKLLFPNRLGSIEGSSDVIQQELKALGPMSREESIVAVIFVLCAVLWIVRPLLNQVLPESMGIISDPMIAVFGSIILFIIPAYPAQNTQANATILDWKTAEQLPWGILLLFGGGLSLAYVLGKTEVIHWVGGQITTMEGSSFYLLLALTLLLVIFLTELMGNMALTSIFLPVSAVIAESMGIPLLQLAAPVVLAASCAFMMPISTPPNAIVYGTGHIPMHRMIQAGVVLNLLAFAVLMLFAIYIIPRVF